jgi:hypothetical protein
MAAGLLLGSLWLTGCDKAALPEESERPPELTQAMELLTDEHGEVVTAPDGSPVTVPIRKEPPLPTNPAGQPVSPTAPQQPVGANSWKQFPDPDPSRPYDLYRPGDPKYNGPTEVYLGQVTGVQAWPVGPIPARVPAAASYIDRIITRPGEGGETITTVLVSDMPYVIFRTYVETLRAAGYLAETEILPANPPSGESAMFHTKPLGGLQLTAMWNPSDMANFEANFTLVIHATAP